MGGGIFRRGGALWCLAVVFVCLALGSLTGCAKPPSRQYYMLTYMPPNMERRTMQNPYACVIRLRDFSIEEAYNRSNIVYRVNPYELRYYNYKSWAVKPTRMLTDLFFRHLSSVQLVSGLVRRFDEGRKPDFELVGFIDALEEYDSEDMLFAHVSIRLTLTKISDGSMLYSRSFDRRKKVYTRETGLVIKEMSQIVEYIFTEAISDIDGKLATEFGITDQGSKFMQVEEPSFTAEGD
ncbi:MAG: ABC-type transport auxiliary lipoprotein family protein [Chitinispirillales bacterium]|nr:ABC-type transport auxiliary lipoprotein family protein [Chitinispirillales bacterium]